VVKPHSALGQTLIIKISKKTKLDRLSISTLKTGAGRQASNRPSGGSSCSLLFTENEKLFVEVASWNTTKFMLFFRIKPAWNEDSIESVGHGTMAPSLLLKHRNRDKNLAK
jgi:hypothetical protein